MNSDEFAQLFMSFTTSAYRLEALDVYKVDQETESLELFLAGEPLRPDPIRPWTELVSDAVAHGKAMKRVHLLRGGLTPYLRYEFEWAYPYNLQAGEEIYILEHSDPQQLFGDLPADDFWLFDDSLLVVMDYGVDGTFRGAERVEDPSEADRYRRSRDLALQEAISFREYLSRVRNS